VTCRGLVKVLYSTLGKVYIDSEDIYRLVKYCKYRDVSGRFFGILELTLESILSKLRRFPIPGIIFRGVIVQNSIKFTIYCSVDSKNLDIDILPILYLDDYIVINCRFIDVEIRSLIACSDVMVCLEFTTI